MRSLIRIMPASLLCIAMLAGCAADPGGSPSLDGPPTVVYIKKPSHKFYVRGYTISKNDLE